MLKFTGYSSCLLWPVKVVPRLFFFSFKAALRLALVLAGFLLIMAGVMVSFTVIGACLGIPMIMLGLTLMARGLF
jgi:hypothetical protein